MNDDIANQVMSTLDGVAKSIVGERYSITLLPDGTIGLDLFGVNAIEGTTLKALLDPVAELVTLNFIRHGAVETQYPANTILRTELTPMISLNLILKS
jgi:hypothetical protein